jgi:hypothetical protein
VPISLLKSGVAAVPVGVVYCGGLYVVCFGISTLGGTPTFGIVAFCEYIEGRNTGATGGVNVTPGT